jgi:hypothetical protein
MYRESSKYSQSGAGASEGTVNKEVDKLLKDGNTHLSHSTLYRLRQKYGDDEILDKIQEAFLEKQRNIRKRAKKFAKKVMEKYGNSHYPLHVLLKKAHKYKKKYGMSNSEFEEFRRIYERKLVGDDDDRSSKLTLTVPHTNLSKTLGMASVDPNDGLRMGDKDYSTLQQILRLNSDSKSAHASVVLQSMTYQDVAYEAVTGQYDATKHNPHCNVHPVVAALFLPKMTVFEETMLYANLSYIVKQRYTKKPIQTKPDYELFYNLVSDPNDVVCDAGSPVKDLLNRCQVQVALWSSVLNLRNGRYYDCVSQDLVHAIDSCKINNYDAPDLLYLGDEGTVARRLLSCFSMRPTIVATQPLVGISSNNPFQTQNIAPKVKSMPLITLRLPFKTTGLGGSQNQNTNVSSLEDGLSQAQWFLDEGNVVPKNQSVIYSKGVLVFHVPRRTNSLNIANLVEPYNFNRLPPTISGFERLNDRPIAVPQVMSVGTNSDRFHLRSAVLVETNPDFKDAITGNSAVVVKKANKDSIADRKYWYNPRDAAVGYRAASQDGKDAWKRNTPVTALSDAGAAAGLESFQNMVQTRGTIFVYEQEGEGELVVNIRF